MSMVEQLHGAKALVYIKYEGSLKELAKVIEENLGVRIFWFKADMDPPYSETAIRVFRV